MPRRGGRGRGWGPGGRRSASTSELLHTGQTCGGRLRAYYRLVWEDADAAHAPPEYYSDQEGAKGGRQEEA